MRPQSNAAKVSSDAMLVIDLESDSKEFSFVRNCYFSISLYSYILF